MNKRIFQHIKPRRITSTSTKPSPKKNQRHTRYTVATKFQEILLSHHIALRSLRTTYNLLGNPSAYALFARRQRDRRVLLTSTVAPQRAPKNKHLPLPLSLAMRSLPPRLSLYIENPTGIGSDKTRCLFARAAPRLLYFICAAFPHKSERERER